MSSWEPPPRLATRLRIVTWNLWWRFGPWEARQPAIAKTLKRIDADVYCLQEVFRTRSGEDQAADLADALGGYHVAYGTRFDLSVFEEAIGNAVLSRWPIVGSETRSLPAPEDLDEMRVVLRADLDGPRGPLEIFVTHLNWRLDQSHVRQQQVRALCEFIAETTERRMAPPILCGDLNAEPDAEEVRMLTGLTSVPVPKLVFIDAWRAAGEGRGLTWDNRNPYAAADCEPDRRIDYVLVGYPRRDGIGQAMRSWIVGDEPVSGIWPSDHFGVAAELRY